MGIVDLNDPLKHFFTHIICFLQAFFAARKGFKAVWWLSSQSGLFQLIKVGNIPYFINKNTVPNMVVLVLNMPFFYDPENVFEAIAQSSLS